VSGFESLLRHEVPANLRSGLRGEHAEYIPLLSCGEWLRRERRRVDARERVRTAHAVFTAMGVEAFAAGGA
jgi:hypothetical protein